MTSCRCLIPVSFGELVDKITILEIKTHYLQGEALLHVMEELSLLRQACQDLAQPIDHQFFLELQHVNQTLWAIEDRIRQKEQWQQFDAEFLTLARQVYLQNDCRAAIKRRINLRYGSELCEEKSYNTAGY